MPFKGLVRNIVKHRILKIEVITIALALFPNLSISNANEGDKNVCNKEGTKNMYTVTYPVRLFLCLLYI